MSQITLTYTQVESLNKISKFLAHRDLPCLDKPQLLKKYDLEAVDCLIILGSSLTSLPSLATDIFNQKLVKKIMLVGGIGHSTHYLYDNILMHPYLNNIPTNNRAEADIYKDILVQYYHIEEQNILVENQSTNCGSNAKEALRLLHGASIKASSFILMQDPTMQLRTYASFLHEWQDEKALLINYSPYIPQIILQDDTPLITGMDEKAWSIDRFVSLLLGEIPRLHDTSFGYGPQGKNFIAHVHIPDEILECHRLLLNDLQDFLRERL